MARFRDRTSRRSNLTMFFNPEDGSGNTHLFKSDSPLRPRMRYTQDIPTSSHLGGCGCGVPFVVEVRVLPRRFVMPFTDDDVSLRGVSRSSPRPVWTRKSSTNVRIPSSRLESWTGGAWNRGHRPRLGGGETWIIEMVGRMHTLLTRQIF